MFTASGLLVRFLKVFEKSGYQSVKWVRYLSKANGSYQIRVSSFGRRALVELIFGVVLMHMYCLVWIVYIIETHCVSQCFDGRISLFYSVGTVRAESSV